MMQANTMQQMPSKICVCTGPKAVDLEYNKLEASKQYKDLEIRTEWRILEDIQVPAGYSIWGIKL